MDEKDIMKDEFLRKMVGKSTIDSLSADFTQNVMNRIYAETAAVPVKRSFLSILLTWTGYLIPVGLLAVFFISSDIPFTSWIPGKTYFAGKLFPYIESLFTTFKSSYLNSKSLSIPVMIVVAAGIFFVIDRFLGRQKSWQ